MTLQERNADLVRLLIQDFQRRSEPNFAMAKALSVMSLAPGLRGLWTTSSFDENSDMFDMSGQGRTLTAVGDPTYNNRGLAPYVELDGTGDWFSTVDDPGLDIIGNEAYVDTNIQGITFGGWVWFDNATGALEVFISKWAAAANRSYLLYRSAAGNAGLQIYDVVPAVRTVIGGAISQNTWHHMVGQLDSVNNFIRIYIDGGVPTNLAVPAGTTITNSNAAFQIGAASGTNPTTGRASLCFLYATALSHSAIQTIYHQTKSMFAR